MPERYIGAGWREIGIVAVAGRRPQRLGHRGHDARLDGAADMVGRVGRIVSDASGGHPGGEADERLRGVVLGAAHLPGHRPPAEDRVDLLRRATVAPAVRALL